MPNSTQSATNYDGFDIRSIFKTDERAAAAERDNTVLDRDWIRSRFMVPTTEIDKSIAAIRFDSSASLKYTDTSIGGSIHVNPRPQYNPMTDPKISSILDRAGGAYNAHRYPSFDMTADHMANTGMGAGYSTTIDDNQEVIFLEFGLPKFNSLIDFFFRAVDYKDSVLANTGRPAKAYNVGKAVGTVAAFVMFPIITASIWTAKLLLGAFYGDSMLKFYYFNPQMNMYWATVNTLVTQLVTEQGLLNPVFMDDGNNPSAKIGKIGMPGTFSKADIKNFNDLLGQEFISGTTSYVDVFMMVTRAQRAANQTKERIHALMESDQLAKQSSITIDNLPAKTFWGEIDHHLTFGNYLKKANAAIDPAANRGDALPTADGKTVTANTTVSGSFSAEDDKSILIKGYDWASSKLDSVIKGFDSSIRQGGAFAVFAVNHTGSTSESFSNSVTSINIGDTAKQLASKSRSLSFDLARGNVFGDTLIQDGINAAADVLRGVVDGVTLNLTNVIASLTGNAYVEVPKRWNDSSMNFQQKTYTMELRSPYNHFISQLQNIYIPLCMVLAGVLPLATGKSSYTSPFLCTLFNKGVESIRLGMITSVTISRGTTTLGFDKKKRALGIDISFTVTDFSTMITSPVNSSIFDEIFNPVMEDDTPLGNYLSVLGSRDILHNKYASKRVAQRLTRRVMTLENLVNPDRIGYLLGSYVENSLGALVSARSLSPIHSNNN